MQFLLSKVTKMSEISQRFSVECSNGKQFHMINAESYAGISNNFIRKSRDTSG